MKLIKIDEKKDEEIFPESAPEYDLSDEQLNDLANILNPPSSQFNSNSFDQTREFFTV